MMSKVEETMEMKVFPKGQVVIPATLRKKYNIQIGDHVQVIPEKRGILLKPSQQTKNSNTLTSSLKGIFKEYGSQHGVSDKETITKATEDGLLEGWQK